MDDIQREYSARLASGGREIAFSNVQRLRPNGLGPFPGRYHLHGIPDCRSYAVSNAIEGVLSVPSKGRGEESIRGSGRVSLMEFPRGENDSAHYRHPICVI